MPGDKMFVDKVFKGILKNIHSHKMHHKYINRELESKQKYEM